VALNLNQFARRMGQTADNLPRAVDVVVKAVARAVGGRLIDDTPVDTGEARSNRLPSLGVPIRGTIAPYQEYPKGSKGAGQGRGETANAAGAKARLAGAIAARQPGQSIIIQNNVEHIQPLNAGTSAQAPAMFVQMGVAAGIKTLNETRIKL